MSGPSSVTDGAASLRARCSDPRLHQPVTGPPSSRRDWARRARARPGRGGTALGRGTAGAGAGEDGEKASAVEGPAEEALVRLDLGGPAGRGQS